MRRPRRNTGRRGRRHDPNMIAKFELLANGQIMVDGKTQTPWMDIAERGADLRPVWREVRPSAFDPKNYQRPERIEGGVKVGPIYNDPGYLQKGEGFVGRGKNSPHISVRSTKRRFRVQTTRPALARVTQEWVEKLLHIAKEYVVKGVIPTDVL